MIFKSVVTKLWIAIVILFVVVLSGLGILLTQSFDRFYLDLQEKNLTAKARDVISIIRQEKDEAKAMDKILLTLGDKDIHVTISDPEGSVRSCTPGMGMGMGRGMGMGGLLRLDSADVAKLKKGEIVTRRGENPMLGIQMLSVAVPDMEKGKVNLVVKVWAPLDPITETTGQVNRIILGMAIGGILLATLLSFIVSKKLSRPLLEMNKIATQMRYHNFDGKVQILTDDEIGRLGNTLNILSEELKNSLAELSAEKDRLSNILASMTEGVITFGSNGEIIMMNPRAASLFNITGKLPVGEKLDNCCPIPELKEIFHTVQTTGKPLNRPVNWADMVLSVRMSPLYDLQGTVRGVVCVVQDVTKEHKLEKMRKDFVANVSHELRNPLFLLQGYGEALQHNVAGDSKLREEIVDNIVEETLRLQRIVNDILDLANLESDKIKLNLSEVNFRDIMDGIAKRYQSLCADRQIRLAMSAPEEMSVKIDPDRITQVLINLIDNAFRFTGDKGEITVEASLLDNSLVVSVADNGQGIPEEELPYVWERFYKVEKSRNRKEGGTGLGLAIVKNIIDAHGGSVNMESKKGKGTKVTFTVPVK